MARSEESTRNSWLSKLASVAVVVAALYFAKGLLVPFTLVALLSFLLAPLCDALERRHVGRITAVLMTTAVAFAVLGILGWTVTVQVSELAHRLPEYEENVTARLQSVNEYVGSALRKLAQTSQEIGRLSTTDSTGGPVREDRAYPVRVISPPAEALHIVGMMFGTLMEILGTAAIVIVFVIFFLVRREDLRDRFIRLVGQGQVTLTTQALDDAARRVSKYLGMQLLINTFFGMSVALGLYLIGIPNALLCGMLATALRFIPYIGPWIAAAIPMALALAISADWMTPLLTFGIFVVLELVINNVLEPWLYGAGTGVSPVAILAAAVFWTWLWGGAGLLVATPLTVCLVVLGKYVPQLKFLSILLGDEPVLDEKTRVYQRLLAGDAEEASDLIAERFEKSSLVEVYDTLLLPALGLAEREHHNGDLDEFRHQFVCQSVRDLVDEVADWEQERQAVASRDNGARKNARNGGCIELPDGMSPCILCLPARDLADEIAGAMLARVLQSCGFAAEAVSVTALASEMVELVARRRADVVCISAMPPAAVIHARYLCKRLRFRFPQIHLVVGLWTTRGGMDNAKERIACGENTRVAATLADALEQIRLFIQPLLFAPDRTNANPLDAPVAASWS